MLLAYLGVVLLEGFEVVAAHGLVLGEQAGADCHAARCIRHPDGRSARVARGDLHRRVRARRGRTADQQRLREALPFHLACDMAHLFQRRGDQAGQADDVDLLFTGLVEDLLGGDHHAHVHHFVVVALEHHRHDVLADVVHVALHGGDQDLALGLGVAGQGLLGLDVGHQVGDRLLHHARRLHHLRQEHLAGTEEIADHIHAVHQRTFDHLDRAPAAGFDLEAGRLGVLDHELRDAMDERMRQSLGDRPGAPGEVFFAACGAAGEGGREFDHAFGRGLAMIG